jgi:pimeloyl-ACP methyl ester carboxylesterase
MTPCPFILIHSPLVGTLTWQPVADVLRAEGHQVVSPELIDSPNSTLPFWRQEVDSIDISIRNAVLVGHSGAGALLPAIGEKLKAYGYLFVDAVLQFAPATRLELMASEDADFARQFKAYLTAGGTFPNWTDEPFQTLIPEAQLRQRLLDDMRPRDLHFFTERIDVPVGWDSKPCGYLQLSAFYDVYAMQAKQRGWPVFRRNSHHFEMLTQPEEIARLLIDLREQLNAQPT